MLDRTNEEFVGMCKKDKNNISESCGVYRLNCDTCNAHTLAKLGDHSKPD